MDTRKRSHALSLEDVAGRESETIAQRIREHSTAAELFLEVLETIESTNRTDAKPVLNSAASLLLDVKMSQREIFKLLDFELERRRGRQHELEGQKMLLQNLIYERNYLKVRLDECKKQPTPNLERMSRDELDDEDQDSDKVINHFLCGSIDDSIQDPGKNEVVMKKLHTELNSRGSLQRDLEKSLSDLTKRRRVAEEEKAFLTDIPKKLEMIERTSAPLQKFFQSSTTNTSLRLIGTDRKKRLDMARLLSGPLYSLFVQFQAYLDDNEDENVSLEIARHSKGKKTDEVAPDPQVVHLSFVMPDILSKETTKRRRVTVEFAFVSEVSLVTAQAFGFIHKINAPALLDNLFPGDIGKWIGQPDDSTLLPGKPYHWCNFLAGVHLSPPAPTAGHNIYLSTKAVILQLGKKVRANATLTQILTTFDKRKPSPHPIFSSSLSLSSCGTKLSSWVLAEEGVKGSHEATYHATIKSSTASLSARVVFNWSLYPAQLPTWYLCSGEESWGDKHGSVLELKSETNPIFDSAISQIETEINGDCSSLAGLSDSTTFDWILSHQLIKLMILWDSVGPDSLGRGNGNDSSRNKMGRDRVNVP